MNGGRHIILRVASLGCEGCAERHVTPAGSPHLWMMLDAPPRAAASSLAIKVGWSVLLATITISVNEAKT